MSELLDYLVQNDPQFRQVRLASLYSDFRPLRNLNPDGFSANLSSWIAALTSALRAGKAPSTSATPSLLVLSVNEDLVRALETRQCGQPLALGTVIREAMKRREMMELIEFMGARESVYRRSWAVPSPWAILVWGFRQLGLGGGESGEDRLPVGKVVVVAVMEDAANVFEQRCVGKAGLLDRIYSKRLFMEEFGDVLGRSMSAEDMEIFLKFLARDKSFVIYDGETVKIKARGEEAITQEDTTIAHLKTLIKDLEAQTTVLEQRVDQLALAAKQAVANKHRVSALAALKSKKLAESTLVKRHATLSLLEEVITKIEQARDQVDLVRVMEASTDVLSVLNKQVGGVERVDDVVDQLREQMTQVDEVGNVITEVGQGNVDETEVDDELEAMEAEETQKREEKERKVREEREGKEAEETKRRLDALQEVERQAAKAQAADQGDKELQKDTKEMRELALNPGKENVTA